MIIPLINKTFVYAKENQRKNSDREDALKMKLNFSGNLIKYRKSRKFTQAQLASMLSVTPQAVSKWENGSYPDCVLLPEISKVLDVSLDVLFGLKEEDEEVNLNNEILDRIRKIPDDEKGRYIMKLCYNMICAYNSNTALKHASMPDTFTQETFAHLRTDYELAISRLNPDMQYCCFMCIPENGINSYFSITPRIIELFSLLSDENSLKVISYAETLGRNYVLTKECISKKLLIPLEIVSEIVDKFERFGIMWQLTANTDGKPFPIYGYVHNIPLVGILTLAESLIHFIVCREPDIDTWTKTPFRIPESYNKE